MWSLKNKTNEQRKRRQTKKQTLNYREQTDVPKGMSVGGVDEIDEGN